MSTFISNTNNSIQLASTDSSESRMAQSEIKKKKTFTNIMKFPNEIIYFKTHRMSSKHFSSHTHTKCISIAVPTDPPFEFDVL